MNRAMIRESVTLAGLADRARVARAFVAAVLGPGHPSTEDAVLLVSEMFGNSVGHSRSGDPGETITVAVKVTEDVVRVEVTDRSGPGGPELNSAGRDEEGGRGLQLVAGLATRWGWRRRGGRTITWFEIRALPQPCNIPHHPVRWSRRRLGAAPPASYCPDVWEDFLRKAAAGKPARD